MTNEQFLISESKRLYQNAISTDKESFLEATQDDCDPTLSGMIHRIANTASEQDFVDFMVNGDTPPIELNAEEMSKLQGAKARSRSRKSKGKGQPDRVTFFNNEGDITFFNNEGNDK